MHDWSGAKQVWSGKVPTTHGTIHVTCDTITQLLCMFSLSLIRCTHYTMAAQTSVNQRLALRNRAVTCPWSELFLQKFHQVYTSPSQANIYLLPHHPSYLIPTLLTCLIAPSTSFTKRISQGAIHDSKSQLQRYAPFTYYIYQIGSPSGWPTHA